LLARSPFTSAVVALLLDARVVISVLSSRDSATESEAAAASRALVMLGRHKGDEPNEWRMRSKALLSVQEKEF